MQKVCFKNHFFGIIQVDIHVLGKLRYIFNQLLLLFLVNEVLKNTCVIICQTSKKLLGITKAKKCLAYAPYFKWSLKHDLVVTNLYQLLAYKSGTGFKWFTKIVSEKRRIADSEKKTDWTEEDSVDVGEKGFENQFVNTLCKKNIKRIIFWFFTS